MEVWSDKQRFALQLRRRPDVRYHLFDGSTRSGKSHSVMRGFLHWIVASPGRHRYLVATHGRPLLEQIVGEFEKHAIAMGVDWNFKSSNSTGYTSGNSIFFAVSGAGKSESRIRGLTYRGVFLDEIVEMKQEFALMAASRCFTYPDWKVVSTCNPDSPSHWAYDEYVTPAINGNPRYERCAFTLHDNPILNSEELEELIAPQSDLWRRRMLRGEWCAATGAVFPFFEEADPPNEEPHLAWLGIDSAQSGVTHAILFQQHDDQVYAADEWRYDGRARGPLRMERQTRDMKRWLGDRRISYIVIDPATPNEFKSEMADVFGVIVGNALNDIRSGINATSGWLEQGFLKLSPRLKATKRDLSGYVWDPVAASKGIDLPIKHEDHGADALRYGVATYPIVRRRARRGIKVIPNAAEELL